MAPCERARLRAQRGPRLGRNVLPLQRKLGGRPVSPGSRRLGAPRTGNRNTKRKGNQPALTCKQGFHLEEPSQTEPRNTHLHPDPPVTNPLARPRAQQAGTRAGGGCSSRPHRLRPRVREEARRKRVPSAGPGCPACGWEWWTRGLQTPTPIRLGVYRIHTGPARSPVAARREGAGLHFGARGAG